MVCLVQLGNEGSSSSFGDTWPVHFRKQVWSLLIYLALVTDQFIQPMVGAAPSISVLHTSALLRSPLHSHRMPVLREAFPP